MSEPEDREPRNSADVLRTFLEEPTLWPVLAAGVGIAGTLVAALLVLAIQDRNPFAILGFGLLAVMAGRGLLGAVRERRLGAPRVLGIAVAGCAVVAAAAYLRLSS